VDAVHTESKTSSICHKIVKKQITHITNFIAVTVCHQFYSLHWLQYISESPSRSLCSCGSVSMVLSTEKQQKLDVLIKDIRGCQRLQSASTRCTGIQLLRVRTSTGHRSFPFHGPSVWNSLPSTTGKQCLWERSKGDLKTYLFGRGQ